MNNYTEIVNKFNELKSSGKVKSNNNAAKAMNISSAALSRFLNGKYTGDNDDVSQKIESFIKRLSEIEKLNIETMKFLPDLSNTKKALSLIRMVHLKKGIGVVVASAGLGKTESLKNYAQENDETIYLKANLSFSTKILMQALASKCGYSGKGLNYNLMNVIIDALKGSGRLLIVDQAEYLPEKALDMLREIQEESQIGLVLAGLPALLSNLRGRGSVNEQLITRIDALYQFKPWDDDDIERCVTNYIPEAQDSVVNLFVEHSRRNGRVLFKLIDNSKRIAQNNNRVVKDMDITKAAKQLVK